MFKCGVLFLLLLFLPLEIYANDTIMFDGKLVLTDRFVRDSLRKIDCSTLRNTKKSCSVLLRKASPLIDSLFKTALSNIESNIIESDDKPYFGAGKNFGTIIYTRDISFSGILGLNDLYPSEMLRSLKKTRDVRLNLAFHVSKGHVAKSINAGWLEDELKESEFLAKYKTNSYTRRTDDVVWLWAARDLFEKNPAIADWSWLYKTAHKCFEVLYEPFYDKKDGLYRGQASFVDIHFDNVKTTGYPQNFSIDDCVALKALSTNCLYYEGLKTMSVVCDKLGFEKESVEWKAKAWRLKEAIIKNLMLNDGSFAYFKHPDGTIEQRRDALGSALAVITGIVSGNATRRCLQNYPVYWYGVPLFYPFYPLEKVYHNNSSWPFVDTFFLWARCIAYNENNIKLNMALLARTCVKDSSFHEYVNFKTKEPCGSGSQLWSAAAFINVCIRANLIDKY